MISCAVTVTSTMSLHGREAARFVHADSAFESRIRVACGAREMDGKSIMGLLLLAAAQGTTIEISADGPDEQRALATLCELVQRGFDDPEGVQGSPCG